MTNGKLQISTFLMGILLICSVVASAQTLVIDQLRGSVDTDEEDGIVRGNNMMPESETLDVEISLSGNTPKSDILIDLSGLKDPEDEFSYKLSGYPVPASDILTANIVLPFASKGVLEIIDLYGRSISEESYTLKAGRSRIEVKINHLVPGNYFMRWTDEEKQVVSRFIKG